MKFKEKSNRRRAKSSELQNVVLQFGRDTFKCQCTTELAKFLRDNGFKEESNMVLGAMYLGRKLANELYIQRRKVLQPDWTPEV